MTEKAVTFELCDLEKQLVLEEARLAPYGCRSRFADQTRIHPEKGHAYRMAFARDRDRIVHSRAFRRLKHKRQVFLTNVGDHYRTRLTHTMEVSQLARTIVRTLGLNEDLAEAVALGHDLGHTPFGHLGETVLNKILSGQYGQAPFPAENLGGFKHNYQSLRVVDWLERRYEFPGLNLTAPVREGIIKHTGLRPHRIRYPDMHVEQLSLEQPWASTVEGQVVAIADEIAQRTHDLEDGIRAGLVDIEDVRKLDIVRAVEDELGLQSLRRTSPYLYRNRLINGLINLLVTDVIETTLDHLRNFFVENEFQGRMTREVVKFSGRIDPLQKALNKFIYHEIIYRDEVRRYDAVAEQVILHLYRVYAERPELLQEQRSHLDLTTIDDHSLPRLICDHIAGMTDPFAVSELKRFHRLGYVRLEFDIDELQLDWMQ